MNFFLAQGLLSTLAWYDMLVAAVYACNRLPHRRVASSCACAARRESARAGPAIV
jgi:hypothetical protein